MVKFDGVRMQDLVEVQDPDPEGGLTLVFKDDIRLKTVSYTHLTLPTTPYE